MRMVTSRDGTPDTMIDGLMGHSSHSYYVESSNHPKLAPNSESSSKGSIYVIKATPKHEVPVHAH